MGNFNEVVSMKWIIGNVVISKLLRSIFIVKANICLLPTHNATIVSNSVIISKL